MDDEIKDSQSRYLKNESLLITLTKNDFFIRLHLLKYDVDTENLINIVWSLRGASPVNGSKNRYFFFINIRLHMHSEIRM